MVTPADRALVVAAVLVDNLDRPRRCLSARRSSPPALAGRWEFPGGKVHPGEDPRTALHRELAEELQVVVRLGAELAGPHRGCWPISAAYEMRLWSACVCAGSPTLTGSHDELRWLARTELDTVDWLDADRAVVAALPRMWGCPTS